MKKIKVLSFAALTLVSLNALALKDFSAAIPFGDVNVSAYEMLSAFTKINVGQKMDIICQIRAKDISHPTIHINLQSANLITDVNSSPDGNYSLVGQIPVTIIKYNLAPYDYNSNITLRFHEYYGSASFFVNCRTQLH